MKKGIKALAACVLAVMLAVSCAGLEAYAAGTEPVTISSADELKAFAVRVNNGETSLNAELTKDIDMSGETYTPIGEGPIDPESTESNKYSGTFNGNGHTVTLNISLPETKYVGLFGYIEGATIKNVGVEGTIRGLYHVGGIVGFAYNNSIIENCWNTAEIKASNQWSMEGMRAGGIVGTTSNSTITNCYNTGTVTATSQAAGGITGYNASNSSITNCYNIGTVTATHLLAGGIAGIDSNSSITNCYNIGTVKAINNYGEIAGDTTRSSITNCYYLSNSSGDDKKTSEQFNSGEVTWLLNGRESDGVWKQTLGEDNYPNFTGLTVCYDETKTYYNIAPKPSIASSSATADNITIELDNYKDGKYGNVQYKLIADSEEWITVEDLEANSFTINGLEAVTKYTIYLKYTGTAQIPASDDGVTEVSITTAKYTNSWTKGPSISDWIYGSTPNAPSATPTYGTAQDVTFTYYTDESCTTETTLENSGATSTGGQPVNAGTYYMIASVAEDTGYTGLGSNPIPFKISKKELTITIEDIVKQYDGTTTAAYTAELNGVIEADKDKVILNHPDAAFSQTTVADNLTVTLKEDFSISGEKANNYTLTQPISVTGKIVNNYVAKNGTDYTINSNGWSNTDFVVTAKEGYNLSRTNTAEGDWTSELSESDETANGTLTFYVKNNNTNAISTSVTKSYKIDKTTPTGTIKVTENEWREFLNEITFGLFFKETKSVTITGEDACSGIASVKYYLTDTSMDLTEISQLGEDAWIELAIQDGVGSFSIEPNQKIIIYAKITDNAGNVTYISSDGIVIYTDAVSETTELSYVKGQTGSDLTVPVKLNGNTVSSISNDNGILESGKDYTISAEADDTSVITINKSYLEGLDADDYKLTIDYKPLGVDYVEKDGNAAPTKTSIDLRVRELMTYTAPTAKESLTYNGNAQSLLKGGEVDGGTVSYSTDGENWSTDIPTGTDAGTYKVYYKIEADKLYSGSVPSTEIDVTVGAKELTDSMIKLDSSDNSYVFNGKDIAPTVTVSDQQDGDNIITGNDYEISGDTGKLAYGTYTITVTGQNNYTGMVDVTWNILDCNAPAGTIKVSERSWSNLLNKITFGLFFNETKTVTITGADGENESGIDSISYHTAESPLVDEGMTDEEMLKTLNDTEWKELVLKDGQGGFDIEPDARLIIYAKIADKAGNITYISSDGIVLDATAPVITGVTDGATYYTSQKVTVTDGNLDKVTVNGDEIALENGQFMLQGNREGDCEIIAYDKAGNSVSVTVTMKKTAAIGETIQDITPENVTSEDIDAIREVLDKVEQQLNDENLTDEERAALEELRDKAESMLEKLEETSAEIEEIEKIIGSYDEDTVTSDDKEALSEAIDRIETLLESENLTDEERADLEKLKEKAETLIAAIEKKEAENEKADKDTSDKPEQKGSSTGDDGMYGLYGMLMLLSAGGCLLIIRRRKRQ